MSRKPDPASLCSRAAELGISPDALRKRQIAERWHRLPKGVALRLWRWAGSVGVQRSDMDGYPLLRSEFWEIVVGEDGPLRVCDLGPSNLPLRHRRHARQTARAQVWAVLLGEQPGELPE